MKKKLLLFLFIFLTFGKPSMASSRLPNGAIPNKDVMAILRWNIREITRCIALKLKDGLEERARMLISRALGEERLRDRTILAFQNIEEDTVRHYREALSRGNKEEIQITRNIMQRHKNIKEQFGL